jgi:hypothetical protein
MMFSLVSKIIFAGGFMFCLLLEDEVSNCENFGKNDALMSLMAGFFDIIELVP